MLAIAKATLHDINQVRDDLHHSKVRTDHIATRLLTVEEEVRVWKGHVADNTAALLYVTTIIGHLLPEMECCMS